jgi:ATP-dependent DNA ligase
VVALDEAGRPSFSALQNRGQGEPLHFFVFDLLILRGQDVMAEPSLKRRAQIEKHILPGAVSGPWSSPGVIVATTSRSTSAAIGRASARPY